MTRKLANRLAALLGACALVLAPGLVGAPAVHAGGPYGGYLDVSPKPAGGHDISNAMLYWGFSPLVQSWYGNQGTDSATYSNKEFFFQDGNGWSDGKRASIA